MHYLLVQFEDRLHSSVLILLHQLRFSIGEERIHLGAVLLWNLSAYRLFFELFALDRLLCLNRMVSHIGQVQVLLMPKLLKRILQDLIRHLPVEVPLLVHDHSVPLLAAHKQAWLVIFLGALVLLEVHEELFDSDSLRLLKVSVV